MNKQTKNSYINIIISIKKNLKFSILKSDNNNNKKTKKKEEKQQRR